MTGRWKFHRGRRIFVAAIAVGMTCFPAVAEESKKPSESESLRQEIVSNGLAFLAKTGQSDAGTFSDKVGPGVTALAITAAFRNDRRTDDPMVAEGLKALEGYVKPDGGIYGNGRLRNYETCVAMVCLSEANRGGLNRRACQSSKRRWGLE